MDFLAATKDGIIIYDAQSIQKGKEEAGWRDWAKGEASDGTSVKVVAKLPSPPNAFGHAWSVDGTMLCSVSDDGAAVYDATDGYKQLLEIPKVAPDVGGRSGGVRNMTFSPLKNFLVTYEKWDPQYPENVHLWDMRAGQAGKKLYSCILKGYTSGALPVEMIRWTADEKICLEYRPGEGVILHEGDCSDFEAEGESAKRPRIAEKDAGNLQVSPAPVKDAWFASVYVPESSMGFVARVMLYNLNDPAKAMQTINLPAKVKDARMIWNPEGSAVLVLASSDVDETGSSYFGTTFLYWLKADGKSKAVEIANAKTGLVQDLAWSPNKNEFLIVVGMMPATVQLYDGKSGKLTSTLGVSRRNTLKWNPFGRFVAVGGFGTLAGDLDFFDRSSEETISSVRAALTVDCAWAPDGREFLCCTLAPRMNEGNQISIYNYNGDRLLQMDFKPEHVEGRHADTGAGARTKTQALLFAASWRPCGDKSAYEDRPATPRPEGSPKRKKGLPAATESVEKTANAPAYRPRGAEGGGSSLVAAMMRGEVDAPTTERGWGADKLEVKPLEDWEIRKLERQRKKEEEERQAAAKEAEKQKMKDMEQGEKNAKKTLKALKAQLEELEKLKDKDWDELTEEDEAEMEKEVEIRAQILELEKKVFD